MKKQTRTYNDNNKGNQNQIPWFDAVYIIIKTGATSPEAKKNIIKIYLLAACFSICLTTLIFFIKTSLNEYTIKNTLLINDTIAIISVLLIFLIISIKSRLKKLISVIKKINQSKIN